MAEPELQSVFDLLPDEADDAGLDAEAEADIAAGRLISNDRMHEWLTRLANGERVPRPKA
jgi:hypothetical protein